MSDYFLGDPPDDRGPIVGIPKDDLDALHARIRELEAEKAALREKAQGVALENIEPDDGFWKSCSGCHQTNDGAETGFYPYSRTFQCYLGAGCRECGGLGAVWDDTDYSALAPAPASVEAAREGE